MKHEDRPRQLDSLVGLLARTSFFVTRFSVGVSPEGETGPPRPVGWFHIADEPASR